jgi:hypothetical protein
MGIRMNDQELLNFLEHGHTAIITTTRQDGRPSSVPIWYVMVDGRMYIGTVTTAAKVKHLRRDPRCCVLVEAGERWAELQAVQIQANGVLLPPGPESDAAEKASEVKYAAFRTPPEQMPESAQRQYAESVWLRIEFAAPPVTWDNSKLRLRRVG